MPLRSNRTGKSMLKSSKKPTRSVSSPDPEKPGITPDRKIKTEPTAEELSATSLTLDGDDFTIRARCFNVELRFGAMQADSDGKPVRLDLLEHEIDDRWVFRLKGANQGGDVMIWENDLDDVTLAASSDLQVMALTMVPTAESARELSEAMAVAEANLDLVDLRAAGKISVDLTRCRMDLKKTFQREFNDHFKRPTDEAEQDSEPAKFDCEYVGMGKFLMKDLSLHVSMGVGGFALVAWPPRGESAAFNVWISFNDEEFSSFQLEASSRVLKMKTNDAYAKTLTTAFMHHLGSSGKNVLPASKSASATALRVRFRSDQDIDRVAACLTQLELKSHYVPADFFAETFPELRKRKSTGPTSSQNYDAKKRNPSSGTTQGSRKKVKETAKSEEKSD